MTVSDSDSSKITALIWMAFDPRTPEGEAIAALRAIRKLNPERKDVVGALVKQIGDLPQFMDVKMPFGKYKGERLSVLAKKKPDYLMWVLDLPKLKPTFREQVHLALRSN